MCKSSSKQRYLASLLSCRSGRGSGNEFWRRAASLQLVASIDPMQLKLSLCRLYMISAHLVDITGVECGVVSAVCAGGVLLLLPL